MISACKHLTLGSCQGRYKDFNARNKFRPIAPSPLPPLRWVITRYCYKTQRWTTNFRMRMYNVRLPDKVENDYKSLVGRIIIIIIITIIISRKLYPSLSLQLCVSQCTRGTPPTMGVSRHPIQGTEPYLSPAPTSLSSPAPPGGRPHHEDHEALGTQD